MEAGLYDKLMTYREETEVYPFHMPGHKGGRISPLPSDLLKIDITEIDGFGNLHQPHDSDVIGQAQNRAAEVFGAAKTFFSINGSTAAIIATVCSVASEGEVLAVARNSHVSVYSGLVISGATPVYIMPELVTSPGIPGGIDPALVDSISQSFRGVVITSPTYEGFTSDIEAISRICHERGALLIVDEAHGSHFGFNSAFPKTALDCGADLVIQSVHKTLPSLTQTALLHMGKTAAADKQLVARVQQMLSMVQTTSPSYLLMASIDRCCQFVGQENERFDSYVQRLSKLRQELGKNKNIRLLGTEYEKKFAIDRLDIGKLVFTIDNPEEMDMVKSVLRDEHGLEMEMFGYRHFLAMTSVADQQEGFDRLVAAIGDADKRMTGLKMECDKYMHWQMPQPITKMTPRQAVFGSIEDASISTQFVIPYPPGIPILVPGELITDEVAHQMRYYDNWRIK